MTMIDGPDGAPMTTTPETPEATCRCGHPENDHGSRSEQRDGQKVYIQPCEHCSCEHVVRKGGPFDQLIESFRPMNAAAELTALRADLAAKDEEIAQLKRHAQADEIAFSSANHLASEAITRAERAEATLQAQEDAQQRAFMAGWTAADALAGLEADPEAIAQLQAEGELAYAGYRESLRKNATTPPAEPLPPAPTPAQEAETP